MSDSQIIAVVMPLASVRGGAEQTLVDLVNHQSNTPYDWRVIFLEDGPLVDQFRGQGVPVRVIETGRLRNLADVVSVVRKIKTQVLVWNCAAVLSWIAKAHLYGGLAAWWAGLPAVWFQHGMPRDVNWIDTFASLVPSQGVLCCSKAGADKQAAIWPNRETRVAYPGIDHTIFDHERLPGSVQARQSLGLPPDKPIVGIVGRLQRWKGMHTFVEAIYRISKDYPDIMGLIVGGKHDFEPDYPEALRHQIKRLGLNKQILLVGSQSDIPLWMQSMDIVVHASDREPFGLVVIEAMALEKPVIASNSGGPVEIISPGVNGLLAPFEDDGALSALIGKLLQNPAYAKEIGRAAGQRALEFSSASFTQRISSGLQDLLE